MHHEQARYEATTQDGNTWYKHASCLSCSQMEGMTLQDLHSMLVLLCPDIPVRVARSAFKAATPLLPSGNFSCSCSGKISAEVETHSASVRAFVDNKLAVTESCIHKIQCLLVVF